VILINVAQVKTPRLLPPYLQDWSRFPLWMRSLDPVDRVVRKFCCCCNAYDAVPTGDEDPAEAAIDGVKIE
jgi:hypothetical protein